MSKYDPLRERLFTSGQDRLTLTFAEIDELVPGGLPPSAYRFQAWWAHEDDPQRHVQKQAWMAGGYTVDRYDLNAKTVTFVRTRLKSHR